MALARGVDRLGLNPDSSGTDRRKHQPSPHSPTAGRQPQKTRKSEGAESDGSSGMGDAQESESDGMAAGKIASRGGLIG